MINDPNAPDGNSIVMADADKAARQADDPRGGKPKTRKPNRGSWQKGTSPNPKGRPKRGKSLQAIAHKILSEKVKVRSSKGVEEVPAYLALLRAEIMLAASGDPRARKTAFDLMRQCFPDVKEESVAANVRDADEPSETGKMILEMFANQVREDERARAASSSNTGGENEQ